MLPYDVVIVGAGPTGSLAALVLARAGHRVALLDRAVFPRAKVCGNCVNPNTWKIWRQLGLTDAYSALPHQKFSGFAVHCEGRQLYEHDFRSPHEGPRGIGREIFDDWLLREARQAGVEFFPETTLSQIDAQTGHLQTSRGEFSGRLIFGADGRNSQVARLSGLMPPPRRCHRVAWQTSIPAPSDLDDRIHMHVFEEGYFGYCRYSPEQAVISLTMDTRRSQNPLEIVQRILPWLGPQEWMRMNPISRGRARLGRDRVWLLGDAARVVEPFTGEGITFALTTGLMAAQAAATAFARNDSASAFAAYARSHRQLYYRRAWVNTLLRWTLTTPSYIVKLVRPMKRLPRIISVFSDQVHATT